MDAGGLGATAPDGASAPSSGSPSRPRDMGMSEGAPAASPSAPLADVAMGAFEEPELLDDSQSLELDNDGAPLVDMAGLDIKSLDLDMDG